MPDEPQQSWIAERLHGLFADHKVLVVKVEHTEGQVGDLQRAIVLINSKLDGLRTWVIGALIALLANLLLFIASNLDKFFGAAPK